MCSYQAGKRISPPFFHPISPMVHPYRLAPMADVSTIDIKLSRCNCDKMVTFPLITIQVVFWKNAFMAIACYRISRMLIFSNCPIFHWNDGQIDYWNCYLLVTIYPLCKKNERYVLKLNWGTGVFNACCTTSVPVTQSSVRFAPGQLFSSYRSKLRPNFSHLRSIYPTVSKMILKWPLTLKWPKVPPIYLTYQCHWVTKFNLFRSTQTLSN